MLQPDNLHLLGNWIFTEMLRHKIHPSAEGAGLSRLKSRWGMISVSTLKILNILGCKITKRPFWTSPWGNIGTNILNCLSYPMNKTARFKYQ